mgnify:FL=1
MKLTNALVTKTSQNLDKATADNNAVKQEVTVDVLNWLNNKDDAETFFSWLTNNAVPVKGETQVEKLDRAQSNKNFQNIVNQTPFQRQFFKVEKGKPLTEELRVKKAKTKMVTDGLATQSQFDDKRYHAFIRPIDTTPATPLEVLTKLKKSSGLSNKKLASLCNTLA